MGRTSPGSGLLSIIKRLLGHSRGVSRPDRETPRGPLTLEEALDAQLDEDLHQGLESPSERTLWLGRLLLDKCREASQDETLLSLYDVLSTMGFSRSASGDLACTA